MLPGLMPWIWSFPITCHEQNNTNPSFPSSWPGSDHFPSQVMNKSIQIEAIRSTGHGPAHFQSQFHEQNNAHPSVHIHWNWTCSLPLLLLLPPRGPVEERTRETQPCSVLSEKHPSKVPLKGGAAKEGAPSKTDTDSIQVGWAQVHQPVSLQPPVGCV